jgi:hypothetical protein
MIEWAYGEKPDDWYEQLWPGLCGNRSEVWACTRRKGHHGHHASHVTEQRRENGKTVDVGKHELLTWPR